MGNHIIKILFLPFYSIERFRINVIIISVPKKRNHCWSINHSKNSTPPSIELEVEIK